MTPRDSRRAAQDLVSKINKKITHKLLSSTSLKSMKMEEEVEIIFYYNCPEEDLDIFRK